MAHMAHAENYEDEQTTEEDVITARRGRVKATMTTDEYIDS